MTTIKPLSEQIDSSPSYSQALDDFGITQLIWCISNYSDADFDATLMHLEQHEVESLTAILIQQLNNSLNGKLIGGYLNAIRHNGDILSGSIKLKFSPQLIDLPANFPDVIPPKFLYGNRIQWIPICGKTDWGVIIGSFYSYASHRCCWMWRYIVRLNENSPSVAWTVADTAWEDDLEPLV